MGSFVKLKEKLRTWLIELITQFREEMIKLSPEEQSAAPRTLEDLSYPCQLMVIWARDPEFQIFLITHVKELEDQLVEIYGPIENSLLIDHIEKEVLTSFFINSVGKEKIEKFLAGSLKEVQRYYNPLCAPPKHSYIASGSRVNENPWTAGWMVLGNLTNLDVKELVHKWINGIKSTAKPYVQPPPPEEKAILDGYGTYLYPFTWIGEVPKPKFLAERITGSYLWRCSSERVIIDTYKKCPLIVMRDGYIAIGEKEKSKALEYLNEIMSTLLIMDVPLFIIRENDLGPTTFSEKGASMGWGYSSRSWLFDKQFSVDETYSRKCIPKDRMVNAIKRAELLTNNNNVKTLLLLFLEVHTHYMNGEDKQALVIGWVILVDFYIKELWSSYISKITQDKDRLDKLGSWDVDRRLEALNLAHTLTTEEYDLLMKIKDARNETVHEGKDPKKDIVEKCLEFVSNITRKSIGIQLGKMLPKL